jgi:hypothetical protein
MAIKRALFTLVVIVSIAMNAMAAARKKAASQLLEEKAVVYETVARTAFKESFETETNAAKDVKKKRKDIADTGAIKLERMRALQR